MNKDRYTVICIYVKGEIYKPTVLTYENIQNYMVTFSSNYTLNIQPT